MEDTTPAGAEAPVDAPTAALTGAPTVDPVPSPASVSKRELVAAAADAGIRDPDALTKEQLADALDSVRLTGRPPLGQIAEDAVARDAEIITTTDGLAVEEG